MAVNVKSPDALAGVFSSGSWSHERRQAYDQIVAMLKKLPVTARLRNEGDIKLNSESVVAVKAFLKDLPDFKEHNGIAAWHEGSMHVLKKLQNIGSRFASELLRRQTVMAGHCSFRVVLENGPGLQNLLPTQTLPNIIWHVIVADKCDMTDLRHAIAKEGKFCFSAGRAAVQRLIENVNFNIGQYRSSITNRGKAGKPYLCYAENMYDLRSIDGFFNVYVVRKNSRAPRSKKKDKNSLQMQPTVAVKCTQESAGGEVSNGNKNITSFSVQSDIREPGSKRPLEEDLERSERLSRRRDQKSEAVDVRLERQSEAVEFFRKSDASPQSNLEQKSESQDVPQEPANNNDVVPAHPPPTQGVFTLSDLVTTADAGTADTLLLRMDTHLSKQDRMVFVATFPSLKCTACIPHSISSGTGVQCSSLVCLTMRQPFLRQQPLMPRRRKVGTQKPKLKRRQRQQVF
jgi:hypothetical protein